MKSLPFVTTLLLASCVFGQTSFCISVSDVCCDRDYSANMYQLQSGDAFNWYYIDYEAATDVNRVMVTCELDGFQIWEETFCGCGRDSVYYPTANEHLIRVRVSCEVCPSFPGSCASGNSMVKIYTPRSHVCRFDCD